MGWRECHDPKYLRDIKKNPMHVYFPEIGHSMVSSHREYAFITRTHGITMGINHGVANFWEKSTIPRRILLYSGLQAPMVNALGT